PGITLTGQQWTLTVRVGYAHDAQAKDAPDLCTVLTQPAARVWGALGPPETELQSTTLRFGQALVLQTAGAARSKLLITPQGSPP
ncbi:MAG: hypothetical protein KC620_17670, partial [Myxococcales bacterium]|nr:hypothetical protein [Myxococcales bacterium]